MRFIADRAPLLESVARVQSAAGNGKTIPILGNLLIRAEGDQVTVCATDLQIEASAQAPATVDEPGSACVPADQIYELLRSLPDGADMAVTMEPGATRLAIACGRSRFKLPTLDPATFPRFPPDDAEVSGTLGADRLARLIDKCLFAASTDAARLHLQGIHLHVLTGPDGLVLRAAATSGLKLAYAETPCPEGLEAMKPLTIPTRVATEMRRWLGTITLDVELRLGPDRLRMDLGASCLRGQLISIPYADYQRVLPKSQRHRVRLDAALFKAAVRRAIIAAQATEQQRMKVVRLSISPGVVGFSSRSVERGESQEEVEAEYDGPEIAIAYNSAHLLEIADRMSGAKLDFTFDDADSATSFFDPLDPDLLLLTTSVRG